LIAVTEAEKEKAEAELEQEKVKLDKYEAQIEIHEKSFDTFLSANYKQVSKTLKR